MLSSQFGIQKRPFSARFPPIFRDNRPETSTLDKMWLKTGIQVAQNNRTVNVHHGKQVSRRFEPPSLFLANLAPQNGCFQPVFASFQDGHPKSSRRSPVRQVGVSNEGHCSSIAIGLSNECK